MKRELVRSSQPYCAVETHADAQYIRSRDLFAPWSFRGLTAILISIYFDYEVMP